MIKKFFINIFLLISLISSTFAVSIVENAQTPKAANPIANAVAGAVVIGIGVGLVVGLIIFIIWFIVNKIREAQRKHSDLLYGKFSIELIKCHQNRDTRLKCRNWKTIFFTFKRRDIYLQTQEEGLKHFGKYDGEVIVKDSFVLIAVYRITGIFTRERDIIIVPYQSRSLIKKEKHGKNYELILHAESVDEALNTDYYNQLVIKNPKDNNKLINFNEYIVSEFMEKYIYRQVIRDNLLDFKTSMDRAVEMNPNIQVERKNPKN